MKEIKKVPLRRFPGYDLDWVSKSFSSIYAFQSTNSFSRDLLNYGAGSVKNIHYGDIHTKFPALFDITKENVPFINADVNLTKITDSNYCQVGDLVIADASEDYESIGKCIEIINLNGEKVLAGLHTILAKPQNNLSALGFSGYLMQSPFIRVQIKKVAQGTKVLGLSNKRLAAITLIIPTFSEQQKIAAFLSAIDDKIQQLQKKKNLLEQYKKGVMQRIFNQEIRFKDDKKDYPDWEKRKLGDLNIYLSDGNYGELYPKASEMKSSGVPFIRANNIKNLSLIWRDMKFIEPEHHKLLRSGHLLENDILITTRGDIGTVALVTQEFEGSNINAQICLVRTNGDLNPKFTLQYLGSDFGLKQFKRLQTGTALKQLPKGNLLKLTIPYPHVNEQTKIANFLSSIDDKMNLVADELENTKQFKIGLLKQMFV